MTDTIEQALQTVADLIEATYAHDAAGNRLDEPGDMSGADVVEALCGAEETITAALAKVASGD